MRGRLGIGTERVLEHGNHWHIRHSTAVSRPTGTPKVILAAPWAVMEARWWTLRPAQSLKPASYVCPFCDTMLHATSEHALVAPEGDVSKRRHAHMECVVAERRAGRLVTEDEWRVRR
jgi:hypothetical protein